MPIEQDLLYANDWNQNGIPDVKPDGTLGEDFKWPFTINPDGDMFPPRYFNANGRVHNVRTGERQEFNPEKGDRVGKLGDHKGNGTIAEYLEGEIDPENLLGEMMTVLWIDSIGSSEVVEGAFDAMEYFFENGPPEEISIDFYGINGIEQGEHGKPPEKVGFDDGEVLRNYFHQQVPEALKGPVLYMLVVDDINGDEKGEGPAYGLVLESKGGISSFGYDDHDSMAHVTIHEAYWHGLTRNPHREEKSPLTISSPPYSHHEDPENADFLDSEWEIIRDSMDVQNREFSHPPFDLESFRS